MIQEIAQLLKVDDSQVQFEADQIVIACEDDSEIFRLTNYWTDATFAWDHLYHYLTLKSGDRCCKLPLARSLFTPAPKYDPNSEAVKSGRHPD